MSHKVISRPFLTDYLWFMSAAANGYDDAFSATQVWRAFRNATVKGKHARSDADVAAAAEHMADARRHAEAEAAADAARAQPTITPEPASEADGGACQCSCPPGRGFGYCFEMPEVPLSSRFHHVSSYLFTFLSRLPKGTPPNDAGCAAVDATARRFCPYIHKQLTDPLCTPNWPGIGSDLPLIDP